MKDNTDRMDKAIKEKLNGHEAHVHSTLWKSIESKLPPEQNGKGGLFFKNPFIISFLVVSIVITGIYLFRSAGTQQQITTASIDITSSSIHTDENADKHSNKNIQTPSSDLNNLNNESQHSTFTEGNTDGIKQTPAATGNKHSDSKYSSFDHSGSLNTHATSTARANTSSGNNKHTTQKNNSGIVTPSRTGNQRITTVAYTETGDASIKNTNPANQGSSTNKLNSSATGTVSTAAENKGSNVNATTNNSSQTNNAANKTTERASADPETYQKNNPAIAATATGLENTSSTNDDATAMTSQKLFSGAGIDTTSNTENSSPNNTANNNHAGENIGSISSATENTMQTEDVRTRNTNETNTTQTSQTTNNLQGSADDLSDTRAHLRDSLAVTGSSAIAASAANTTSNTIDSIDTDKKIIDSSNIQKNPEAITSVSQEQKKHASVFLSKCSFDGYITPAFGYIYTAANTSILNSEDSLNKFIQHRNQNTKTGSGITAGLRMNYALSKKIEVGVGFQYSSLSQSSYLTQKNLIASHYTYQGYTMTDSIYDSIQRVYIHRQYFVKTDSSAINSYNTQTKKYIDKYQNFSLPIYIAYGYSITDRLSLLARTSLLINYQLHSVTYLNETEDKIIGHHSRKNISLGGSFSIGGYYAFSRSCSVFAEPVVTYYFSNLFDKQAPIKQTLLMFGLQTGIRLSF